MTEFKAGSAQSRDGQAVAQSRGDVRNLGEAELPRRVPAQASIGAALDQQQVRLGKQR